MDTECLGFTVATEFGNIIYIFVPPTFKLEQEILLPNAHMFFIYDYISSSLSKVPGFYSGRPVRSLTGTRTV